MKRFDLNGNDWQFKSYIDGEWTAKKAYHPECTDIRGWHLGKVPGSVQHDCCGKMPFNGINTLRIAPHTLHDVHGPWHHQGLEDHYTLFNLGACLLHSEFGAEGLSNLKAIQSVISPENQWPVTLDNPMWYHLGAWDLFIFQPIILVFFRENHAQLKRSGRMCRPRIE